MPAEAGGHSGVQHRMRHWRFVTQVHVTVTKKLTEKEKEWYYSALDNLGGVAVVGDRAEGTVTYSPAITTDESHIKTGDPEELAHAVFVALLHSPDYKYPLASLSHEVHFEHGSKGSKSDEVDVLIRDTDGLPYALVELKATHEYDHARDDAIRLQLFGTAPLVGSPKLLIYATVDPKGPKPKVRAVCIDYSKHKSYEAWLEDGEPHSKTVPVDFHDLDYQPYVNDGENDLALDSTQSDFRAVALSFHNEFFAEHADNTIFVNLVKCLLAKIHDERTCKTNESYEFQVFHKNGKPDTAKNVFERVNGLYKAAYKRYIDPGALEIDEINPKEFAEERVKAVVQALEGISITKGAARHGDVIGAFFEEILRAGFKQDRGMYFTHDNIVRFMVEAIDLAALTKKTWEASNHPDNRLPYIIDPACGSGTFLLHAMNCVTSTVKQSKATLVADHDSKQFFNARLSDEQPNYWAENFIYGFDPKFIMAITAKVNMVLHGDGSAHVAKDDAFKPFAKYTDVRLRPCSDATRSVPKSRYKPDLCESFDVVLSNPPFGISLSPETRSKVGLTFSLSEATPSEGLFLERCFQLLKPNGRLGIVLPESALNAKEMAGVRLFLYRCFNVRCVVSIPRNIFIDTPTLTSLVFAQKKTAKQIKEWDDAWSQVLKVAEEKTSRASKFLARSYAEAHTAQEVADGFLGAMSPVVSSASWVSKGGKTPAVLKFACDWSNATGADAAAYFREIMRTSGFESLRELFVFKQVAHKLDHEFPVFMVDEVGYKLSKRREKAKPNQLCLFKGKTSSSLITNLHLADEECEVLVRKTAPQTVLDHIRKTVHWT